MTINRNYFHLISENVEIYQVIRLSMSIWTITIFLIEKIFSSYRVMMRLID